MNAFFAGVCIEFLQLSFIKEKMVSLCFFRIVCWIECNKMLMNAVGEEVGGCVALQICTHTAGARDTPGDSKSNH